MYTIAVKLIKFGEYFLVTYFKSEIYIACLETNCTLVSSREITSRLNGISI